MTPPIQVYEWGVFQASLAATSIETKRRLLAVLVSGLPQGLQEEFRGVAGEGIPRSRLRFAIALWLLATAQLFTNLGQFAKKAPTSKVRAVPFGLCLHPRDGVQR
jgi:hypothetical protein